MISDSSSDGLSHSDTHGSMLARSSPRIFVACHVLPRRLMPRHPPYALTTLTRLSFPYLSKNNKIIRTQVSEYRLSTVSIQLFCLIGGGERDRTDDLLLAKQALSQLSYTPSENRSNGLNRLNRFFMMGLIGIEPITSPLSGVRSNQLSYRPFKVPSD